MVASNISRCRNEAYALFRDGLLNLEATDGLLKTATAIHLHTDPSVSFERVECDIRALAARVRGRLRGSQPSAMLAQLHQVLFDEEGFAGNQQDYYDPGNSLIAQVLDTKRGLPITLTLIYKAVAERLPIAVQGIGAPGHFLARVEVEGREAIVDPFHGGRLLTPQEAIHRVEQTTGCAVPSCMNVLTPVSHAHWIERMLNNLQVVYAYRDQRADLAAMQELAALL